MALHGKNMVQETRAPKNVETTPSLVVEDNANSDRRLLCENQFLCSGFREILTTLSIDFFSFLTVLLFYSTCLFLGVAALLLDKIFRTILFERLIRFYEFFDKSTHS